MATDVRAFCWEDLPSIVDVMNRYAESLGSSNRVTLADVENRWRAPHNHPERDCFVMDQDGGGLSGFTIADLLDDLAQANGVYFVPSGDSGVADQLVKATETHFLQSAENAGAATATMTYSLSDQDKQGAAVLESRGYAYVRQFYVMQALLDSPITVDPAPDGVILRPFDPAHDAQATYEAQCEAFRDHWNFYTPPFQEWMHDVQQPNFDPHHWWIALVGGEIVGLVLSETRGPETAWVGIVGVREGWRRGGLAKLLLQRCFSVHQQQDRARVRLGVDAENRYQATALYERVGMSIYSRTLYYQKQLI